jgi:hypothetical protein
LLEHGIDPSDWGRIRTFVTFGSALEKTRFFFDVRKPTVNAACDQFENDVYGSLFTNTSAVLSQPTNVNGIYWLNLWYDRDVVANEISTYTSDVLPGASFSAWQSGANASREICQNVHLDHTRPFWAFVHGDYLADPLFWAQVGPVVAV